MTEQEIYELATQWAMDDYAAREASVRRAALAAADSPELFRGGVQIAWLGSINWENGLEPRSHPYSPPDIKTIYVRLPRVVGMNRNERILLCEEIIRRQFRP